MMRYLLIACILTFVSISASGQTMVLLYDGRPDLAPSKVSKADEAVFKQQILPAAKRAWASRQGECADGWESTPEIRDVATGAFTKPNVVQRAILYNYCIPAHAYAFNGIAIIESGKVVSHISYQSDWQHSVAAAPDFNGNGLAELIVVSGTTNQGTTWATITLIELGASDVHSFGFAEVLSDSCGLNEKSGADAYRVLVRKGILTEFYREHFRRGCYQKAWRRIKVATKITLDNDGVEYKRLK
jgi:hypothetical protein